MNTNWYFSRGEETEGPVTQEQLIALITAGHLAREHFILPEGTEEWQPIGDSAFAAHVPPAPEVVPVRVYAEPVAVHVAPPGIEVEKRRPVGLIVGVVCALLAIGAGAWFLKSRSGSKTTPTTAGQEQTPASRPVASTPARIARSGEAPAPAKPLPAAATPAPPNPPPIRSPKVPAAETLKYFGKTFEECEKLLEPHTSEETVEQPVPGVARYYKSPIPQASQVRLIKLSKPPEPRPFTNVVGHVTYYFPKESIKAWREAFAALALPVDDIDEKIFPGFTTLTGFAEGFLAQWTPISTEPEADPNQKEEMMVFMVDPIFEP